MKNQKVRKAIIPAAGLGTRFLPATKALAKEMLPIVDKPTIQFIVEEALKSGIEDILVVTGKSKRSIEDHFDSNFELEYNLEQKGKTDLLKLVNDTTAINPPLLSAKATHVALEMLFFKPKHLSEMSHSLSCLVTTSWISLMTKQYL